MPYTRRFCARRDALGHPGSASLIRRAATTFAVVLLAACAPQPPAPVVTTEPPPPDPAPPLPSYDIDEAYALLARAERALASDRLLTPPGESAHHYFSQALALAPDLVEAQEGFGRIAERYIELATQAIEREQWSRARAMLNGAGQVDAGHPAIPETRRRLDLVANAPRDALSLSSAAVRGRWAQAAAQLAAFGERARGADARVTIRAPSDADGRWIYQQLRKSPGERRIRASIQIGAPPKVTILYLGSGG